MISPIVCPARSESASASASSSLSTPSTSIECRAVRESEVMYPMMLPDSAKRYEVRNDDQGSTGGIWRIRRSSGRNRFSRAGILSNPLNDTPSAGSMQTRVV